MLKTRCVEKLAQRVGTGSFSGVESRAIFSTLYLNRQRDHILTLMDASMAELLRNFDAYTMAFLVAILYLSLSAVLVYTAVYRRTYPGFGNMTLAQVSWSAGLLLNYFRPLNIVFSLYFGSALMLLHGVLLYRGLLLYGGVPHKKRMAVNVAAFAVILLIMAYYMFVDYDTCARVVIFSTGMAFFSFRIAVEPYVSKKWKRHATQSVFSVLFLLLCVMFVVRAYKALHAGSCLPSGPDDTAKLLFLMATVITPIVTFSIIAMTFARMEAELRCANEELQAMSETDALTSLANRRKFDAAYKSEWDRAMRLQQPMAVVILDVDDFKHYNDRYGHQVGDACLQALAQVLKEYTRRAMDVAARYGGEEFAMILPGMDGAAATALAEDVRRSFEQTGIEHAGLEPAGPGQTKGRQRTVVTISAGVAALVPSGKESRFDLLSAADTALYAAKALGKNAVVLA